MVQTLLSEIQPNLSRITTSKWLKPLVEAYTQVDGSDEILGSIAASMVNQMDDDSISKMSEQTLVSFAEKVDSNNLSEQTRSLVTDHLMKRVTNGQLTTTGFMKIFRKLALYEAPCQDSLLYIITTLNMKGWCNICVFCVL